MIASATSNAAAPTGAAASFTPLDAAGESDAFAALLDELAAASGDAAAPGVDAITIGAQTRSRNAQLPVELPADDRDASAESRAADEQAADAGLALLLASLTMPAPIKPSNPPEAPADAAPWPVDSGDALASTAVESEALKTNAPDVDIPEVAPDKAATSSQSPAMETQAGPIERRAFERELSRIHAPAGSPAAAAATRAPAASGPTADSGVARQLADVGPGGTATELSRELTAAESGQKPPAQQRFSTDAADAPAARPVSRDDKPVRSPGKAGDAPAAPGPETLPADAAGAPSNASSGSGRDDSPASSSHAHVTVDASAAAPIRAARSAQAFARAIDVHMAAVAAPGTTSHVQSAGVVNATAATIPDDLSAQIVQAVRMQWNEGVGDARITLKPEYLGDVTVSLHVDQGSVTAVLHADSPAVRSWLQQNEPLLGQALSEQGLRLERLVVSEQPPTDDGGAPNDDAPRQEEQPRRRRQRPDAAGFEIIL
jgi:flagellar hook-length control protein FliK